VTRDWLDVWSRPKHGGDEGPAPPVRLRNGVPVKHGELENPKPPADATVVDIGANIDAASLYWAGRDRAKPSVSVLIPTHRDAHLLQKSLPVLLGHPPDDVEIVIVNNDPLQDVRNAIGESADDPKVTIAEMGFEAGVPRALNRGIRESSGGLVMFCNADLFPSATYLAEMQRFFHEHPRAGAAMGKLLRYDLAADTPTDVIDSAGLVLTRQRRMMARGEGERDTGQFDEACQVFAIDGAAPVVRRSALEDIRIGAEYLDENFISQKDDQDLSWRLHLAGWECWYFPNALAYHGRTARGVGSKRYLSAIRSFHQNARAKSDSVRIHAMKNQWLMLVKNEDRYNFVRDFRFILAREAVVVTHNLLFAPRALVAVPMTLKLLRETLDKRWATKAKQRAHPRALRQWLGTRNRAPACRADMAMQAAKRAGVRGDLPRAAPSSPR
jgi:GT2 family glycosyltransferase